MKVTTLILSLIFTTTLCFSQNYLPVRKAFKLNIPIDKTSFYSAKIKASAYILEDKTIQLYPGDTLYVEVELAKKEIKSLRTVKKIQHPDKTLTITFTQQTKGKVHTGMMLKIDNPYKYELNYKASMFLLKTNTWEPTDTLTVEPKLSAIETWPDLIVTLTLSEWAFE